MRGVPWTISFRSTTTSSYQHLIRPAPEKLNINTWSIKASYSYHLPHSNICPYPPYSHVHSSGLLATGLPWFTDKISQCFLKTICDVTTLVVSWTTCYLVCISMTVMSWPRVALTLNYLGTLIMVPAVYWNSIVWIVEVTIWVVKLRHCTALQLVNCVTYKYTLHLMTYLILKISLYMILWLCQYSQSNLVRNSQVN